MRRIPKFPLCLSLIAFIGLGCDYVALNCFNKISYLIPGHFFDGKTLMLFVFYLCLFVFYIKTKTYFNLKSFIPLIVFILFLFLGIISHFQIINDNVSIDYLWNILFVYAPLLFFVYHLKRVNLFLDVAWIPCLVIFAYCLFIVFGYDFQKNQGYNSNMVLGYNFCISSLIFFDRSFNVSSKKIIKFAFLLLGAISTVFVLLFGSRGSTIVIALFFAFYFVKNFKSYTFLTKTFYIVLCCLLIMIFVTGSNVFTLLHINSRTISWITGSDSNLDSSGRFEMWSQAIGLIKEKLFFGYGPFGEFGIFGIYVHNIFLELLLDYGLIIGFALIIFLFLGIAFSLKSPLYSRFASVLLVFTFVQLIFSGSYLMSQFFFMSLPIICRSYVERWNTSGKRSFALNE